MCDGDRRRQTERPVKIAVKLCGHCDPRLDMTQVFEQLKAIMPEIRFCYHIHDPEADILLLLSACPNACVSRPVFDGPVLAFHAPQEGDSGTEQAARRLAEKIKDTITSQFPFVIN